MSLARPTSFIWRLNLIALWTLIATVSVFAGLHLRDWTWKETQPIRFRGDVSNALNVGQETIWAAMKFEQGKPFALPDWAALWKAYLGRYDAEYARFSNRRDAGVNVERGYRFDYPPGRLLIASAWAKHVVSEVPQDGQRPRGIASGYRDEFIPPMRWINIGHELAAALGMFFLVRRVLLNANRRMFVSELLAMLAALLVWFNPALILNAHGWPQWDAWVLPYTIWAIYLALIDSWLIAGGLIALGAMFKGQVLMIAPIFPLWALFSLRFGSLLRFASGFLGAVALLMSSWLVRDALPAVWVMGSMLCFVAFLLLIRARRSRLDVVALAGLVGLLSAPFVTNQLHPAWVIGTGVLTFMIASLYASWPSRPIWIALLLAVAAGAFAVCLPSGIAEALARTKPQWLTIAMPRWPFSTAAVPDAGLLKLALGALCIVGGLAIVAKRAALPAAVGFFAVLTFLAATAFNGSFAWLHVGFQTARYDTSLSLGRVCNLPAILTESFNLNPTTPVSGFGLFPEPMLLGPFLKLLAMIGLVLCAVALAIQVRRRDPNALIPLAAAWTLLYALLPQMHERYLLWGAVMSAVMVTQGVGGVLLHLVLTAIQFSMILFGMTGVAPRGAIGETLRPWTQFFAGIQPQAGYVVVTLAIVLLCWSFRRSVPKIPKPRKAVAPKLLMRESVPVTNDDSRLAVEPASP